MKKFKSLSKNRIVASIVKEEIELIKASNKIVEYKGIVEDITNKLSEELDLKIGDMFLFRKVASFKIDGISTYQKEYYAVDVMDLLVKL